MCSFHCLTSKRPILSSISRIISVRLMPFLWRSFDTQCNAYSVLWRNRNFHYCHCYIPECLMSTLSLQVRDCLIRPNRFQKTKALIVAAFDTYSIEAIKSTDILSYIFHWYSVISLIIVLSSRVALSVQLNNLQNCV